MFSLLVWAIFGLVIGIIAKLLHPGDDPIGCLPTIAIGVSGSFVGGAINWLLGFGSHPFKASGICMSILGGIVVCAVWRWYSLNYSQTGAKDFFGRRLK